MSLADDYRVLADFEGLVERHLEGLIDPDPPCIFRLAAGGFTRSVAFAGPGGYAAVSESGAISPLHRAGALNCFLCACGQSSWRDQHRHLHPHARAGSPYGLGKDWRLLLVEALLFMMKEALTNA